MYDRILYPTDGSAGADVALAHVRELATRYDATVHVLHVVNSRYLGYEGRGRPGMLGEKGDERRSGMVGGDSGGERSGMVGSDPDELRTEIREHAQAIVDDVEGRCGEIETVCEIRVGNPHQIILDYAERHDIDVIVMGTHGREGLDRYLLGSVAEKVVRMSDVPVVTVRREPEVEATA
jgi:nucleotide-binding universal stress UspA family protein